MKTILPVLLPLPGLPKFGDDFGISLSEF